MAAILELEDAIQLDILRRLPAWPFLTAQHGVASVCVAWRVLVASSPSLMAELSVMEAPRAAGITNDAGAQCYDMVLRWALVRVSDVVLAP